ncbi:hypothetical protein K474DRAFT_1562907, partial [Panus rudis PR-1116 ss-1]
IRRAKRTFFNEIIKSSQDSQRMWGLVDWTKPRRTNATMGLVRADGTSIDSQEELKEAFQNQFTPSNPREVDLTFIQEIPQKPVRDFPSISVRELFEAIRDTSNTSAPGPDHCGW